jgi:TonB family protein
MRRILSIVSVLLVAPWAAAVADGEQVWVQQSVVPEDRLQPPPAIPDNVNEVVRNLAKQQTLVQVPAKGKVKHSIDKGAPTFAMPGGPSSVALFQMPDYQGPYSLTIKSSRRGFGRTTEIFIPGGLYFDEEYTPLGSFGEEHISWISEGLVATLNFGNEHRRLRYLLLYTRGDLVGQRVDMRPAYLGVKVPGTVGTFLGNNFGMSRLERSFEAKLEIQREPVGPPKKSPATDRLAGKTQEQLLAEFGPPSLVQDATWYYDTSRGTLRIQFNDDVVWEVHPGDFDLLALPRGVAALTGVAAMTDPGLTPPSLIKEVKPMYTSEARRAAIQGSVFLECIVRTDGACSDIRIVHSLDREFGLDQEAVKAIREWRFKPGAIDNKPVPVLVTVELSFALKQ